MKKISNLLELAVKPISSLAAIAIGLSIISFAAVSIKDNCSALLPLGKRKIRAVVCVKKVRKEEPKVEETKEEQPKVDEPKVETAEEKDIKKPETKKSR